MKIKNLITKFPEIKIENQLQESFDYIYADSRKASEQDIFCIYDDFGKQTLAYIQNTKAKILLISQKNPYLKQIDLHKFTLLVSSSDPMKLHGYIASSILDHPSKKLKIVAITGTNGKTSLTNILYHLGENQGFRCGLIGTIEVKYKQTKLKPDYTTPEPSSLNLILDKMQKENIEYVFMEASSHGLELGRLNGIDFLGGVFTNLSQDHLDFHPSFQDYFKAKFRLLEKIEQSTANEKFAIINYYNDFGKEIKKQAKQLKDFSFLKYLGEEQDFEISKQILNFQGSQYLFYEKKYEKEYKVFSNLLGDFNIENTSLAFSCGLKLGWNAEKMLSSLQKIPQIEGRFEVLEHEQKFAIIDYAHTPDALKNILVGVKNLNPQKIICLCGCGGDRDKTKRPKMAKVACELSDFVILTSDNPRTEEPNSILEDMKKGVPKDFTDFILEVDRKKAIQKGIQMLEKNEFLIIAGKGHEDYQIIGKTKIHFSDREETQKAFGCENF